MKIARNAVLETKDVLIRSWPFLVLSALSIFIIWPIFIPGYFSHHDDLQVMRIYEMRQCFKDFQIPCRWVPDMGYGNGYPLFNYYNVFPYYIGALFSYFAGYINSAKILFLIPTFISLISMYLLGKELLGKEAGFVASVLYLFAPYKALDLYVRGAVAESFALSIIPLIFYFLYRLASEDYFSERKYLFSKNFYGLSLSLAAFILSHNIMTIFFLPIVFIWVLYLLNSYRKQIWRVLLSILIGFGLASFFIIPAFVEKSLVHSENLTRLDLNFRAHFVTVNQLFFSRDWGYGASMPGPADTISLQIGWPHWWIFIITLLVSIVIIARSQVTTKIQDRFLVTWGLIIIFTISIFMTHNRSAFIWEQVSLLQYAQFPWRFLSVAIFSASLLGACLIFLINKTKLEYILVGIITFLAVFLNWRYFKPEKFFHITDTEKLSGYEWDVQRKSAIFDYLPKTAIEPLEPAINSPIIRAGDTIINNFNNRSDSFEFNAKVLRSSDIEVPVYDFPDWRITVNGQPIDHSNKNAIGRIGLSLSPGDYRVLGKFYNTPVRNLSNIITLMSILVLVVMPIYGKVRKVYQ